MSYYEKPISSVFVAENSLLLNLLNYERGLI